MRIDPPAPHPRRVWTPPAHPSQPAPLPVERDTAEAAVREPQPVAAVLLPDDDDDEAAGRSKPPRAERRRSYRAPLTVAAAILLAFVIGAALPDSPSAPVADAASGEQDRQNMIIVRPYTVAAIGGVAMRLEQVERTGRRVDVRVRVLGGFEAHTLREAFFDVVLDDGTHLDIDDAHVRAGRSRFFAGFVLPTDDVQMRQIRITGIRTAIEGDPVRLVSTIGGAWPVERTGRPRVVDSGAVATVGRTSVRWASTILWSDRVEIVLDLRSYVRDAKRSFGYAELFEHDGASEPLAASFVGAREEGDRMHLDFVGVREDASRLVLYLGDPTTTLDGPWTFSLTGRSVRVASRGGPDSCADDLRRQRHPCP